MSIATKCTCGSSSTYCTGTYYRCEQYPAQVIEGIKKVTEQVCLSKETAKKFLEEAGIIPKNQIDVKQVFKEWLKNTGRSGGVLVGKSINEFLDILQERIDENS